MCVVTSLEPCHTWQYSLNIAVHSWISHIVCTCTCIYSLQDPSSTRSAWYTPPHSSGSVAPPHQQLQPHPPRPPSSSSSSSHRSRSTRHGSSRGSHRRSIQLAAHFSQQDQQSLNVPSVRPPSNTAPSVPTSGTHSGDVDVSSISAVNGGYHQLLSPRESVSSSHDHSVTSGVGSSVSSLGYSLNQTGRTPSERSSSLSTREGLGASSYLRRESESLPRVGKIATSDGSTHVSGRSGSLANSVTANNLHHPKPLFSTHGRSASNK